MSEIFGQVFICKYLVSSCIEFLFKFYDKDKSQIWHVRRKLGSENWGQVLQYNNCCATLRAWQDPFAKNILALCVT